MSIVIEVACTTYWWGRWGVYRVGDMLRWTLRPGAPARWIRSGESGRYHYMPTDSARTIATTAFRRAASEKLSTAASKRNSSRRHVAGRQSCGPTTVTWNRSDTAMSRGSCCRAGNWGCIGGDFRGGRRVAVEQVRPCGGGSGDPVFPILSHGADRQSATPRPIGVQTLVGRAHGTRPRGHG